MSSKSGPLQRLPTDLHLTIIYILEPLDIVCLGKTCKALREASTQSSVWAVILGRVCIANGVFRPSYQFATLSGLEMQRIALFPERIISLYKKHLHSTENTWTPSSKRNILPGTLDIGGNFTRFLFLVPGGRFLVTYSGHHKLLCIWDLNSTAKNNEALIQWEYFLKGPILCSQNPEGDAIRVATLAKPRSHEAPLCYTIFEYNPMTRLSTIYQTPLTDRAHIDDSARSHHFVSEDIYGEVQGSSVYLWNFIRNLWTSWRALDIEDIEVAFVNDFRVILIGLQSIACWDIPQLSSWVQSSELLEPVILPARFTTNMYHFRSPSGGSHRICSAGSSWYNGLSDSPFRFDVIQRFSQQSISIPVFGFFAAVGIAGGPGVLKCTRALIRDRNTDGEIAWDNWRVLGGEVLKCFNNQDTIQLWAAGDWTGQGTRLPQPAGGADRPNYEKVVNLLYRGAGAERLATGEFSFDAFSGRLCYASMSEEGSVAVVDYL